MKRDALNKIPSQIYLLTLCIVSFIIIFYKFDSIPANLAYDEVASTQLALHLRTQPPTFYSPLATGHTTPYYYIILGSFTVFGVNTIALRLPSAIFGILAVLVFYEIVLKIYHRKDIAFMYSLLFITMRWYFNFARFSFEATFLIFLELLSIKFLLEEKIFMSALFAGFAFYSYIPGRIFFVVPLIYLLLFRRAKLWTYLGTIAVMITPLLAYYFYHPDLRISQISILQNSRNSLVSTVSIIIQNAIKFVNMLGISGDMNGRHNFPGKPALNPAMMVMFLSGIIAAFRQSKRQYTYLFLLYMTISAIPTLFTPLSDNPNMLRTIGCIPATVYIMGNGVLYLSRLNYFPKKLVVYGVLSSIILISIGYELRTYFLFQSRVFRNSFEVTCSLKTLSKWDYAFVPKQCGVHKNEF